jgi:hypothetical protein
VGFEPTVPAFDLDHAATVIGDDVDVDNNNDRGSAHLKAATYT